MSQLSKALSKKSETSAPHLIIQALAGTGKTTTLVEGLKIMRGEKSDFEPSEQQAAIWESLKLSKGASSVCFVAFNKAIAEELGRRVPQGCRALTMHSLGFQAVRERFGSVKLSSWRVTDIICQLTDRTVENLRRYKMDVLKATEKLVGFCKMNLVGIDNENSPLVNSIISRGSLIQEFLPDLVSHYDVDLNGNQAEIFNLVPRVLDRCKDVDRDNKIDFNDMIWLPVVLDLPTNEYDLLLVDECFPAGTIIETDQGGFPIEEIVNHPEKTWQVLSNQNGGKMLQYSKVTAAYATLRSGPLVGVKHEKGEIFCTGNHPLWVKGKGWVPAGLVEIGDTLSDMRVANQSKKQVLLAGVCSSTRPETTDTRERDIATATYLQENESSAIRNPESNEPARGSSKAFSNHETDRTHICLPGWEWYRPYGMRDFVISGISPSAAEVALEPRTCRLKWSTAYQSSQRSSNQLQDRHCISQAENCNRSRRQISSTIRSQRSRLPQNQRVGESRVVGITVYQQASKGQPESYSPSGHQNVFTLSVEAGSYFADGILVKNCQDLSRCQQALACKVGRRLILCGDSHQCHPAGVLITKTGGQQTPIEALNVGDQLVSYNSNLSYLVGTRTQGRRIEAIASRDYEGDLYDVNGTLCTPNHKWLARISEEGRKLIALYIMELADGSFRIGQTQLMLAGSNGFGPGLRARQEGAVKLWVLETLADRQEAREYEFKESLRFQIPQRAQYEVSDDRWPRELIDEGVIPQINELLAKYDKLYEYPAWEPGKGVHIGRYPFVTQACNLFPGVSLVASRKGESKHVQWRPVEISITPGWSGKVYSLKVQPTEKNRRLYLAAGNVVSNSIYGFAGADSESMARMQRELEATTQGCETLPLTITRRCGRAIVREAQKIVPAFEAHESCCEGTITRMVMEGQEIESEGGEKFDYVTICYRAAVQNGDMVLCRVNAPLVSECFAFLREGHKANIRGRDVGAGLISTIKKQKATSIFQLVEKLSQWIALEEQKEQRKQHPSESRLIALKDRYDCLQCFIGDESTVEAVVTKIESVFTDDKTEGILLSSIHRAKGLEAKRVFLLEPEGATVPHPMAKSKWQIKQEWNLRFIAITRAREELIYVS